MLWFAVLKRLSPFFWWFIYWTNTKFQSATDLALGLAWGSVGVVEG